MESFLLISPILPRQTCLQAFGLWSKRNCKIVVIGLDGSGKTTLINQMKPKKASFERMNGRWTIVPNLSLGFLFLLGVLDQTPSTGMYIYLCTMYGVCRWQC